MESSSPGLLKNGKMNLCTSTGSRENQQNKVEPYLWDTLYYATLTMLVHVHVGVLLAAILVIHHDLHRVDVSLQSDM